MYFSCSMSTTKHMPHFSDEGMAICLDILRNHANRNFFLCEDVVQIINLFPHPINSPERTPFCKVEAVISLFSRIIDLENFKTTVEPLFEQFGTLFMHKRLGILNTFNPMCPEGECSCQTYCYIDTFITKSTSLPHMHFIRFLCPRFK